MHLVALENASYPSESNAIVEKLALQLKSKRFDRLRKDFLVYIKRALKLQEKFPQTEFNELNEVKKMLSKRVEEWEENIRKEARQKGRQGQLTMLTKMIEKRGLTLSVQSKEHLAQLNNEELLICFDKILNNEPLEELLES